MKVLHLISGGETGGSKNHLLSLLAKMNPEDILLGVFQEGKLSKEASELGIPLIVFGQTSRYDFSILQKIKSTIKDQGIQIVHTHGPRANLFTLFVRGLVSFKWVTTIHSDPKKDFIKGGVKGRIFTSINMYVIKKIDHFFAVSERFSNMVAGFGIPKEKITTIYNGISFDTVPESKLTREELQIESEEFVVCMVARLHPIKGHTVVFDAINQLKNEGVRIRLLLIGDGPLKDELTDEVSEKELGNEVEFLGFQEDVHSYLALSDVKLLASYSESFPLVILEAARAHTPVISTDVGGVKELISDESLGWIVPIKCAEAIAQSIKEAMELKNNARLKQIGNQLYKKASANYSVDQLVEKTEETYKEIMV